MQAFARIALKSEYFGRIPYSAQTGGNSPIISIIAINYFRNNNNLTEFEVAVKDGNKFLAKLLLDNGCDTNTEDGGGCDGEKPEPIIVQATKRGLIKNVQFLLDIGVEVDSRLVIDDMTIKGIIMINHLNSIRDPNGLTAFEHAVENGNKDMIKLLLPRASKSSTGIIFQVAKNGQVQTVQLLMESGVKVDTR